MNITASVFINDNESGLHSDFEIWLEKLAPEKPHSQYAHNGYEDNKEPDEQGRRVLKLCDGFTHNFSAVFAAFFAAKIPSRRSFEAFCDGS
jgi:hypothetical protein